MSDSPMRPYANSAEWLADAAMLFATRISDVLDNAPNRGAEVLLGCLPATQAHALVRSIHGESAAPTDTEPLATVARRLGDAGALAALPIGRLLRAFDLPPSLGPFGALLTLAEADSRFAPLFGFLNDDAQRRHLTPAVAETLGVQLPIPPLALLAVDAPLRAFALVASRPSSAQAIPDRPIRWHDHVVGWLLADSGWPPPDPELAGFLQAVPQATLDTLFDTADADRLALVAARAVSPLVLLGSVGSGRAATAQAMAAVCGRDSMILSGPGLASTPDWPDLLRRSIRDATLRGDTLIIRDADDLALTELAPLLAAAPCPMTLTAADRIGLEVDQVAIPPLDQDRSRRLWRAGLGETRTDDADQLAHRFRLGAEDILHISAALGSTTADLDQLSDACLERSSRTLDRLATRVQCRHDWSDLVLPARQRTQLERIASRFTHGRQVFDRWGFGEKLAPNRGLTALFTGPSGAGKTLSAAIIAGELGVPLYRVDLSATVSKYIGETEKNLEAIFTAAEAGNACLFFDECDALFGKRSEVNDAHDRYANIETSYLLQRLELHRGIVMMASNHPQNIDEAFSRRIDVTVEFPMPDAAHRSMLWERLTPAQAEADINFGLLGERFELSGGSIRNCLLAAAFLAASEGGGIETDHCTRAVAEEYQKTGKPLTRAEFGDEFALVRASAVG